MLSNNGPDPQLLAEARRLADEIEQLPASPLTRSIDHVFNEYFGTRFDVVPRYDGYVQAAREGADGGDLEGLVAELRRILAEHEEAVTNLRASTLDSAAIEARLEELEEELELTRSTLRSWGENGTLTPELAERLQPVLLRRSIEAAYVEMELGSTLSLLEARPGRGVVPEDVYVTDRAREYLATEMSDEDRLALIARGEESLEQARQFRAGVDELMTPEGAAEYLEESPSEE